MMRPVNDSPAYFDPIRPNINLSNNSDFSEKLSHKAIRQTSPEALEIYVMKIAALQNDTNDVIHIANKVFTIQASIHIAHI